MSSDDYSDLRVLVLRENWLGSTGWSVFNALLHAGVQASTISEGDYIPLLWRGFALRALGKCIRPIAVREFNRGLLREARSVKPHLFLAVKGMHVLSETLRTMKREGISVYCFYPDISIRGHGPYLPSAVKEYDWVFTTKSFGPSDLKEIFGIANSSFLPHAFPPELYSVRPIPPEVAARYECDVSFIGHWTPKKERILDDLIRRRPTLNLRVWGDHWSRLPRGSPLRPHLALRAVIGTEYATAVRCSKINLGLLTENMWESSASSGDRITQRTFHIP
ncbi:MAG: hypothetical protein ACRD88_05195, partial [Terriglobia bacterium]